jgi:hypothetical protein
MNHALDCDYRISCFRDVEAAISGGITSLFARNQEQPWFDGLFVAEYSEVLFGALLTASQAYCVGSIADINEYREEQGLPALGKIAAYHKFSLKRGDYSEIEFVNAAANCFKHRDEWGEAWPDNLTVKTLAAYSITKECEFPLNDAFSIIRDELGVDHLADLLSDWREGLLAESKKKSNKSCEAPGDNVPS